MEQSKFYQIKNVTECEYTLVGCDGSVITRPIQEVDKIASAFTIQDAKDGDVLVCIGKYGQETGIIKEYVGKYGGCDKCFETYCFVDWDGIFRTGEYMGSKEIHPATKEQRDTLMKAMTDAGYTFDFEKKELKKIERKPAWSEEELDNITAAINNLEYFKNNCVYHPMGLEPAITFLKSLKDRVQPKQEWSEEDEYLLNETIKHLEALIRITKKQGSAYSDEIQYYQRDINWLKSLRPQKQWKPSDEQMHTLEAAIANYTEQGLSYVKDGLNNLYEQLKKL